MSHSNPLENPYANQSAEFNQELHNDAVAFVASELPREAAGHYADINMDQFAVLAELDAGDLEGENNRFVICQNRMAPEGASPYVVFHGYVKGVDADGQKQYGITVVNRLELDQPLELGRDGIGEVEITMQPDETVSRQHATVTMSANGELTISDHSMNGTQIHYAKAAESSQPANQKSTAGEQLPAFYENSWAKPEQDKVDPVVNMLNNLRSELTWGRLDESRISSLYSVARNIGDTELFSADQDGRIRTLLESSRSYARPRKFVVEQNEHATATHSEWDKVLTTDLEKLDDISSKMADYFESIGEPLKERGDAILAVYLGVAAHEAGHAMLSGVSRLIHGGGLSDKGLAATRAYLSKNPEAGLTGNWETDVAIQEERFAEGNGELVLRKTFDALGYEPEMIEKIIAFRAPSSGHRTAPEAGHQLDHLDKVSKDKTIAQVMQEVVNEADLNRHNQAYLGNLGYSLPLTETEVVNQLLGLDELLRAQDTSGVKQDPSEWEEKVRIGQSADTKAKLEALRQSRSESFN